MRTFVYQEQGETVEVQFEYSDQMLKLGDRSVPCDGQSVWLDGRRVPFWTLREGDLVTVWCDGKLYSFEERDPRRRSVSGAGSAELSGQIKAQMPGKVLSIAVAVGDTVEPGQELVVMESMKMELSLESSLSGTVTEVNVELGDMVSQGQILLEVSE